MKQIIFTLLIAVGLTSFSYASTADLFNTNTEAIEAEFEQISAVESFVLENENITFSDMESKGHLAQFDLNWNAFDNTTSPMFGLSDIDWGSFFCGFCCWPVGIFTVLLNDNKDSDQKTSYIIGAVIGVIWSAIGSAQGATQI